LEAAHIGTELLVNSLQELSPARKGATSKLALRAGVGDLRVWLQYHGGIVVPDELAVTESERLTHLESLLMHLQYEVEQLNKVLLDQRGEIDQFRRELRRFRETAEEQPEGPRDPAAEKPPHY
jgi:uncharacterized coiled-coil protein SlyX